MRRHERQRRREAQRVAVGADGPGDPLDSIHVTVRLDAPACSHCNCYERETCSGTSFPCCLCGRRNPAFRNPEV